MARGGGHRGLGRETVKAMNEPNAQKKKEKNQSEPGSLKMAKEID